ncbi:MAG TPA: hypothetical protein VFA82_01620, partial [Gaiellaceae bacterium]|nr:hypothetical protein [Gaiellaceae bacterium]
STHCGGSPHFGTVDLGSKSYNTSGANIDFKGTGNGGNASEVDWTFSSLQLTFTLGTTSGSPAAVAQNLTATYAVDSAMTDIAGNAAAGTASDTSTGTSFHF